METSRRNFIKGSALATAGIVFGTSFAGLSGCSSAEQPVGGSVAKGDAGKREATIHDTDVLIIGGGCAGLVAARRATDKGAHVTILDKGKFGHSSSSGINWGQVIVTAEFAKDGGAGCLAGVLLDYNGMLDQNWANAIVQASIEGKIGTSSEQLGYCLQRNPDGTLKGTEVEDAVLHLVAENRPRVTAQYVARTGTEIYGYTAALDILLSDEGKVAGAVALNIRTGEAYVFRAKTVIMATGSFAWACGNSISGPETTGVGQKIFFDQGLEMMNMELQVVDLESWQPYGERHEDGTCEATINGGIVNGEDWDCLYNGNKEPFTAGYFDSPEFKNDQGSIYTYVYNNCMQEIMSGRAGESGGIYLDQAELAERREMTYSQFCNIASGATTKRIGYEMPKYQECVVEIYQTSGVPAAQTVQCETEIPGLYSALQGASTYGSIMSHGGGWITGGAAADQAASIDSLPKISWDDVQSILDHAYGLLEAEPANPIRSIEVYDNIRAAARKGLIYPTDGIKLQATIDELKRIEKEEIPNMVCGDKSKVFNRDWMNAMEVESMIRCLIPAAEAGLMRTETRPYFVRSDYPVMDNENWLKNIIVKYENGEYKYEVRDIVDTFFSVEQLKEMMPLIDLSAE